MRHSTTLSTQEGNEEDAVFIRSVAVYLWMGYYRYRRPDTLMAFPAPVWLAVQDELLGQGEPDEGAVTCFDHFDDETLFQLFHLTRPCITFITDAIRIRMKTTDMKKPVLPVDAMLMVALNYYAHGISSNAVLQRVGLSEEDCPTTIVGIVSGVLAGMTDHFISFPLNVKDRVNVAKKTENFCGIPRVLGILAPAHFKIRASPYDRDMYKSFVNTLSYTSVVSQFIFDSDGNILSVEKCCAGSTYEQEMWETSFKGREMEDGLHGSFWVIGEE